ncbi:kelch-like protein 12 [Ciona intestinalis]
MSVSKLRVYDHCNNTMQALQMQRGNKLHCDVTILVERKEFPAHRCVLSASSEYFNKMFSTKMSEQFKKIIEIKGINKRAMAQVLDFIYTDTIELSVENVQAVLHTASLMQIQDLLNLIIEYLFDEISGENCLHFHNLGRLYSLGNLMKKAEECCLENFDTVCVQDNFCEIKLEDFEKILKSEDLIVESETVVFESLMRWTEFDLDARTDSFPRMFQHVRLQLLDAEYIFKEILNQELVRVSSVCRDAIDSALYFHVDPSPFIAQKYRGTLPTGNIVFIPSSTELMGKVEMADDECKWSSMKLLGRGGTDVVVGVQDGHLCSFGGFDRPNLNSNNCSYPTTSGKHFNGRSWKDMAPAQCYLAGSAATFIEGDLFVFGGVRYKQHGNRVFFANYISMFTPSLNTWTYANVAIIFRTNAVAVSYKDTAYILGGFKQVEGATLNQSKACADVEIYKKTRKVMHLGNHMVQPRASFGAAVWDDKIFVCGGIGDDKTELNSCECMEIESGVWTLFTIKVPRKFGRASICCVGDHIVIYCSSSPGQLTIYDGLNDRWITVREVGKKLFHGTGHIMLVPS